ncbi:threonine aldolase family protein [Terricaulis sp.]|uniref:threonine aldolase family protein n=1 Tax=Terricaulis sp. TaxID=2768686 RepID=UPI0037842C7D
MNFRSDNTAAAAAEILAALAAANDPHAPAYGEDQWSKQLDVKFGELFEHEVRVFTVATGTAANAIALASLTPPWGKVFCHREAHIERDECGAPEFFSGGAKLALIDGPHAKISADGLREALARSAADIHAPKPAAVSISQTTERGGAYAPGDIAALAEVARDKGLALHMDGARFANAVAALGCSPADISWRAGVDILSFGATKNGALAAEAIVVFDPARADEIARRRKRGGHLFSKGRYAAAQLLAYVDNGLWLSLAGRANGLAARLAEAADPWLSQPVQTNQLFLKPGAERIAKLRAAGVGFYDWGGRECEEIRLVVSWNQADAEVDALAQLLRALR